MPGLKSTRPEQGLSELISRARKAKGLTIAQLSKAAGIRKAYICDLEHGRRGQKMNTIIAAKLAASLDIPIAEIQGRLHKLTDKEQRSYADYHRVLRSSVRAQNALDSVATLQQMGGELRECMQACISNDPNLRRKAAKEGSKLLQRYETTVKMLDAVLSYKRAPEAQDIDDEGDDAKFTPGRPVSNVR